jgi:hypothetical protein
MELWITAGVIFMLLVLVMSLVPALQDLCNNDPYGFVEEEEDD